MTPKEKEALRHAGRMCVAMDVIRLGVSGRGGVDVDAVSDGVRDLLNAREDYDRAILSLPMKTVRRKR